MSTSTLLQPITQDIFQVRQPLPFALRIVNCYLLHGSDGWDIVDTGLHTSKAKEAWETVFAELKIRPGDIRTIVLTHVHPDHFGLAGWLQRWNEDNGRHPAPPVIVSEREAEMVEQFWRPKAAWEQPMLDLWRACGVPPELASAVTSSIGFTRSRTLPHPYHFTTIQPGASLELGRRRFRSYLMPGHSDGQLVFHDSEDRLLLCGDHILSKITPNISMWPFGETNPLGRYLASFHELSMLEVRLTLPGHGPIINDLHGRIAELQQHHAERLELTIACARGGTTVYETCQQIFGLETLSVHEKRFALAETLAHLEHLRHQQQLRCHQNGVWLYELL